MEQNEYSDNWKQGIAETINSRIRACRKCDLHRTRTKAVPGSGCLNADMMFVGEGPGKNEDLTGMPFVGQAGKILDSLLQSIHLSREDIFIGNTVKCRPPQNRMPTSFEMNECRPYLIAQIELINPMVLVVLGSAALSSLFEPGLSISKMRGKPLYKDGICFFPTYHPAAALYQRKTLDCIQEDFFTLETLIRDRKSKHEN